VWLEGRFGGETSIVGAGSVEVLEQKKNFALILIKKYID
jgi:predicted transcriptional regulator with HTH domain